MDNVDSKRLLLNIQLLCERIGLSLGVRLIYQSDGFTWKDPESWVLGEYTLSSSSSVVIKLIKP